MTSLLPARDYGPGCPRHSGDPHNLCEACWALEPDAEPLREAQDEWYERTKPSLFTRMGGST